MTDCLSKPNHSLTKSLTDFYILSSLTFNRKIWIILIYPCKVSLYYWIYIWICSDILSCNWKLIESRSDFSSGFEQTMGILGTPLFMSLAIGWIWRLLNVENWQRKNWQLAGILTQGGPSYQWTEAQALLLLEEEAHTHTHTSTLFVLQLKPILVVLPL